MNKSPNLFWATPTWRHKEKCPQGVSQKKLAQPDMGLRVARLERDECILHSFMGDSGDSDHTVLMVQKSGINSPVEEEVVEIRIFARF